MKKILIVMLLLLSIPMAFAEVDDLEIYSFKVYADGKQQNIDWDDDGFRIEPGTELEIQIRFNNKHPNQSVQIDVRGILFDVGDDIERTETLEIDPEDKESVVFEFFVPEDESEGYYDLEVSYTFEHDEDGTDHDVEKTFEVEIWKEPIDINDVLLNITQQLANERVRYNDLLESMNNFDEVAINATACAHSLGRKEITEDLWISYKADLATEQNKTADLSDKLSTCNAKKENLYTRTQVDNMVADAKRDAVSEGKKETNNTYMMIGFAVLAWWMWKKKGKDVGGKGVGAESIADGW